MIDLDDDLPPRVVPYGYKQHPMYKQWLKMLDSCTDPMHPLYPQVGAKGIGVMYRWFSFPDFIEDNEHLYDTEPSRPTTLRRAYISRTNLKAGFNPKNLIWVTKRESVAVQTKTVCVDTVYGKNMPLKALAAFLADHEGEDRHPELPPAKHWVRTWNPSTDKTERVLVPLTTIQAVKLQELRRRLKAKVDLFAPVREYGTDFIDEDRETALTSELDRNRIPIPADAPYWVKNRGFV